MIYHVPEPDGEENPGERDPRFKKALEESIAAIEPTLVLNPETGEEENHEEDTPLSDLIEDDGGLNPEMVGKVEEAFGDEEWEKIEARSNSRRYDKVEPGDNGDSIDDVAGLETKPYINGVKASMKAAEIDAVKESKRKARKAAAAKEITKSVEEIAKERLFEKVKDYSDKSPEIILFRKIIKYSEISHEKSLLEKIIKYGEDSPERTLFREIMKYDEDEMFSYSSSLAESMQAADGPMLIKALDYYLKEKYGKIGETHREITRHHERRNEPVPEKVEYIMGELENMIRIKIKKKVEEETTTRLKEEYQKMHGRKPNPDSKRWIDPQRGLVISADITPEDEEKVRREAEAYEELRRSTLNPEKAK